jgi:hypothetical protein
MNDKLIDLLGILRDYDPVSLIEVLGITSDDLIDALRDYVEDHQEEIEDNL